jgi:hypothetical protein
MITTPIVSGEPGQARFVCAWREVDKRRCHAGLHQFVNGSISAARLLGAARPPTLTGDDIGLSFGRGSSGVRLSAACRRGKRSHIAMRRVVDVQTLSTGLDASAHPWSKFERRPVRAGRCLCLGAANRR